MWDVWFPRKERSFAHTYAVLDEFTEKIMVSRGAPPERVVVTGNPAFDVFAEAAAVRNSERRQELGLSDERLLVYFGQAVASNGAPDDHATLRWLIDAMQPTDRLIFCKHPRDDREYSHILKHADGRLVQSSWNSDQLLSVADVCLTHYSMMGLKSALLNFPTINLLLDDDLPDIRAMCGGFPLSLVGGSYEAHSPEALKVLLAGQLLGTASKVKSALHVDGKSTERVVRVVTGE